MLPRARRLIFLIRVYLKLCKSMKQFAHKWFCTQKSAIKCNFGLYPCCCRQSISCCPQRSSPVRSDRWTLGPGEAVKQAVLIVLGVSQGPCGGVCVCYPSVRPVELFKDVLEILHGSVCYQHDGLVAQAPLTQRCSLHANTHRSIAADLHAVEAPMWRYTPHLGS